MDLTDLQGLKIELIIKMGLFITGWLVILWYLLRWFEQSSKKIKL